MESMPDFDLTTEQGKQEFRSWVTNVIRNEINSYARQVLTLGNTGENIAGKKITVT